MVVSAVFMLACCVWELQKSIRNNNLICITTRQPTYWPSDPQKIPDLIDFCIAKGINSKNIFVESSLELTSDHTPLLVTILTSARGKPKKPSLTSSKTNWSTFRAKLDGLITLEMPLKTNLDIEEAVETVTKAMQEAARQATDDIDNKYITEKYPIELKEKLREKGKARKRWQNTRSPADKHKYNRLAKELIQVNIQTKK
jgi:hypothetical protein